MTLNACNGEGSSEWSTERICIHCDMPKRVHMGKTKYCATGETVYESKSDVRVVRHVGRSVLGSQAENLVPLSITDDRNENPDYEAWRDI